MTTLGDWVKQIAFWFCWASLIATLVIVSSYKNSNPALRQMGIYEMNPVRLDRMILAMGRRPLRQRLSMQDLLQSRNVVQLIKEGELQSKYDQKDCCFCLDLFVEKEVLLKFPCEHYFHYECLENWFQIEKFDVKCPLCNTPVEVGIA